MKKAKKVLAFALAIVMCFSLAATAFADNGEFTYAEDTPQAKDYSIVTLGNSTSNGFGLDGIRYRQGWFDNCSHKAYPYLIGEFVQKALGAGWNVTSTNLAFEGQRTDEIRAFLDPQYVGDDFCQRYIQSYINEYNSKYRASVAPDTELRDYYLDAVKNADCIIFDGATNNFGSYFSGRLQSLLIPSSSHYKYHKEGFAADTLANLVERELPGTRVAVETTIKSLLDAYGLTEALEKTLSGDVSVQDIIDLFVYCYADCCVNFKADIELMRKLNPDVQIIACGMYNHMEGLKFKLGDTMIDFGGFWGAYMDLVDTYITALCPYNNQYYFADCSKGLHTFQDNLAEAKTPADIYPTLAEDLYNYVLGAVPGGLATVEGSQKMLPVIEEQFNTPGKFGSMTALEYCDYVLNNFPPESAQYAEAAALLKQYTDVKLAAGLTEENVLNVYMQAANLPALDVAAIIGIMSSGVSYNSLCAETFSSGTIEGAPAGVPDMIHMLGRFLVAEGVGNHPDETGCQQKFEAVKQAWLTIKPASQSAEDSISNFWHDFGSTLLKTFQNPLLEKINELFVSFVESFIAFWQGILGLGK